MSQSCCKVRSCSVQLCGIGGMMPCFCMNFWSRSVRVAREAALGGMVTWMGSRKSCPDDARAAEGFEQVVDSLTEDCPQSAKWTLCAKCVHSDPHVSGHCACNGSTLCEWTVCVCNVHSVLELLEREWTLCVRNVHSAKVDRVQ